MVRSNHNIFVDLLSSSSTAAAVIIVVVAAVAVAVAVAVVQAAVAVAIPPLLLHTLYRRTFRPLLIYIPSLLPTSSP